MRFEAEADQGNTTLDGSVPIIVRSNDDEYMFQFACNLNELKDLKNEVNIAIKFLEKERGKNKGILMTGGKNK